MDEEGEDVDEEEEEEEEQEEQRVARLRLWPEFSLCTVVELRLERGDTTGERADPSIA